MANIKAIPTRYRGYAFRSRLEARYAVFLDALGVRWEYESQGYDLGEAGYYLPDFWLPVQKAWIEIKGVPPSPRDAAKIRAVEELSRYPCLCLVGMPGDSPITWVESKTGRIALATFDKKGRITMKTKHLPLTEWYVNTPRIARAINAARSARFEHGEMPR